MTQAFHVADTTAVLPLDFMKLVWGAMIGYAVFAEVPDAGVWLGGVTVFAAATYIAYRESQNKQVETPATDARGVITSYSIHYTKLYDVMYNDFVIIGFKNDPAGIKGMKDATAALQKIAAAKSPFASRGDNSGTHKKELSLWRAAGVDAPKASGTWYRETGSGMGATLYTASAMNAYTLSDRATWLNS